MAKTSILKLTCDEVEAVAKIEAENKIDEWRFYLNISKIFRSSSFKHFPQHKMQLKFPK